MKNLEKQLEKLKEENHYLKSENEELKYILNDIHEIKDVEERRLEETRGCVILDNGCCSDFVGILLNNGYTVQITPLDKGRKFGIFITEEGEQ